MAMTLERANRHCCWCKKPLGWCRREYCNAACKQKHYRYRKRGMREPRKYDRGGAGETKAE